MLAAAAPLDRVNARIWVRPHESMGLAVLTAFSFSNNHDVKSSPFKCALYDQRPAMCMKSHSGSEPCEHRMEKCRRASYWGPPSHLNIPELPPIGKINLDGCRHVYLDVGSNVGDMLRLLFEGPTEERADEGSMERLWRHHFGPGTASSPLALGLSSICGRYLLT